MKLRLVVGVLLVFGLASCATSSGKKDDGAEAKSAPDKSKKKERNPRAPSPDQLSDSPCGQSDWAKMPEQHQVDGDPDEASDDSSETDDETAEDDS